MKHVTTEQKQNWKDFDDRKRESEYRESSVWRTDKPEWVQADVHMTDTDRVLNLFLYKS